MEGRLTVVAPGDWAGSRFAETLEYALRGREARVVTSLDSPPQGGRFLFAVPLDGSGVNRGYYDLIVYLRGHPGCLEGGAAGLLVDGAGALYTKSVAHELAFAVNQAGCALVGRPLVEATGDLRNFSIQAKNTDCSLEEAYRLAAADLAGRILSFDPPGHVRPKITVLHASSRRTSNTLALWGKVRQGLEDCCGITEIGLRNGTMEDCAGCTYTTCLHFGEQGGCFYGGIMVREVYPAVRDADALVLLCPNYNDALSANLTAAINRLTALYRTTPFTNKAAYGIVVSGYSGGDIVARQLMGALGMNKGFYLPPYACLLETAKDAGSALRLPGIEGRLAAFTARMRAQLTGDSG